MLIPSILRQEPVLWPLLIILAIIYILPHTTLPGKIAVRISMITHALPKVVVDLHPSRTQRNRFSTNRTVLYMETRPEITHVTPLLLHMTKIVPPEWRFVFLGTEELVSHVGRSAAVSQMVERGKLRLGHVERWTDKWKDWPDVHETHSRLLTNLSFYEEQFPGVEWLLNFRSTAIMCANANRTLDHYLQYDWVGAPWRADARFGGSGGLSLRRLSRVKEILRFQTRQDNSEAEDRWLSKRVGLLPQSVAANASVESAFSVEDLWHDSPLGYHVNPALAPGISTDVWSTVEKRKRIFDYCPEIKMVMTMRLERERCPPEEVRPPPEPQRRPAAAPEPAAAAAAAAAPASKQGALPPEVDAALRAAAEAQGLQ